MWGLWREVNEFFSSTSIHGFSYISNKQSRSTRTIWTLIVLAVFGVAAYLVYQTLSGFNTKFVSTTIETKSIKEYPFPAVTFHPGDYNSEHTLLKTLLNQFEFTRYDSKSILRNNEEFGDSWSWIVYQMSNQIFGLVKKYLIEEQNFVLGKVKMFETEICSLVSLYKTDTLKKTEKEIRIKFIDNMYKFRQFSDLKNFLKKEVSLLIESPVENLNFTSLEILNTCNDDIDVKIKMGAFFLSHMYLFLDAKATYSKVGAGDLAAAKSLQSSFSRGKLSRPYSSYYLAAHTLVTNMFNAMVNGSLPVSVLEIPGFFVVPDHYFKQYYWTNEVQMAGRLNFMIGHIYNMIELNNFTKEALRNYHLLWRSYISKVNITIYCLNSHTNCLEEPLEFSIATNSEDFKQMQSIQKNPGKGKIIEVSAQEPPCTCHQKVESFKIDRICNFIKNVSHNKLPFLKLMKFSKQSPVSLEEDNEHYSVFTTEASFNDSRFTVLQNNNSKVCIYFSNGFSKWVPATQYLKSRSNPFVAMCSFMGNVGTMKFDNCNLFKRSYTTKGIGFTFNNEKEGQLIKEEYRSRAFFPNTNRNPSMMQSASLDDSLLTIIENNAGEVQRYENTIDSGRGDGSIKPKKISVSLHNPREPADIRSKSFTIPLGQSTTVYITPRAREIDESGGELTESQRNCRLDEDTDTLDIFSTYTRAACMFECKMKYSMEHCGCVPWNFPMSRKNEVRTEWVLVFLSVKFLIIHCFRKLKFVTFMGICVLKTPFKMLALRRIVIVLWNAIHSVIHSLL